MPVDALPRRTTIWTAVAIPLSGSDTAFAFESAVATPFPRDPKRASATAALGALHKVPADRIQLHLKQRETTENGVSSFSKRLCREKYANFRRKIVRLGT